MKWLYAIFILIASIIPLRSIILGGIPFWHDPARDLLLAQDNLQKLTLIGPPGGIPGIFYLPYWIWLLSIPMVFNQDPRWIVLTAITLPSMILFSLLLWRMRNLLGGLTVLVIWAIFIVNYNNHLTFPWSPYPASLLVLLLAYLVYIRASVFFLGIVAALVSAFNFSFGITVIFGTAIFVILTDWKKTFQYFFGVCLVYIPFLVFEIRHDFLQTRAFSNALLNSIVYNRSVVEQTGIPKNQIIDVFLGVFIEMWHLPPAWVKVLGLTLIILGIIRKLWRERLFILFSCISGSLLMIYSLNKNPTWPYHFIGVEMIFLLLIGLVSSKVRIMSLIIGGWSFWLFGKLLIEFFNPLIPNYLLLPTLVSKESIAKMIIVDAGQNSYTLFAYSPASRSYEYEYLFKWLGKNYSLEDRMVYLILPSGTPKSVGEDFINYKTPGGFYKTEWEKFAPDGTKIIKRVKQDSV